MAKKRQSHLIETAEKILNGRAKPAKSFGFSDTLKCELSLRYNGIKHEFDMRVIVESDGHCGSDSLTPTEVRKLFNKMVKLWSITEVMNS